MKHVVLMGVCGCGKTTVGMALASRLGVRFIDADDYHSTENVAKMSSGTALNDMDRQGWLQALREQLDQVTLAGERVVLACSALKKAYRDQLRESLGELSFFCLSGREEVLRERLLARSQAAGHFMGEVMLTSQLEIFEPLQSGKTLSIEQPLQVLVDQLYEACCGVL